jgi:ABC-type glutathione transport system ATPase component
MVIWLMGLSGSGKTTLGRKLEAYLSDEGKKCAYIDGDEVRAFFDSDLKEFYWLPTCCLKTRSSPSFVIYFRLRTFENLQERRYQISI